MREKPCVPLIFIIIMLILRPLPAFSKSLIINSEKQYKYAISLMDKKDYKEAISEFKRFIYFFPDDQRCPTARYLIGKCFLKLKEYEKARSELNAIYNDHRKEKIGAEALFLIAESYFLQGAFDEAEDIFSTLSKRNDLPYIKNTSIYRLSWIKMKQGKWEAASKGFNNISKQSPLYPLALELSNKIKAGEELHYKNPALAGLMAGIIPGMGHAYCNRYRDGAVSFLLNVAFIFATIQAFDKDLDALGGILGFAELGWYTGNIYSAVNCTHKHNRRLKENFIMKISKDLKIISGNNEFGFAFNIGF